MKMVYIFCGFISFSCSDKKDDLYIIDADTTSLFKFYLNKRIKKFDIKEDNLFILGEKLNEAYKNLKKDYERMVGLNKKNKKYIFSKNKCNEAQEKYENIKVKYLSAYEKNNINILNYLNNVISVVSNDIEKNGEKDEFSLSTNSNNCKSQNSTNDITSSDININSSNKIQENSNDLTTKRMAEVDKGNINFEEEIGIIFEVEEKKKENVVNLKNRLDNHVKGYKPLNWSRPPFNKKASDLNKHKFEEKKKEVSVTRNENLDNKKIQENSKILNTKRIEEEKKENVVTLNNRLDNHVKGYKPLNWSNYIPVVHKKAFKI